MVDFPQVLNFNRFSLKLNQFVCQQAAGSPKD